MNVQDIIFKKRDGFELSDAEIEYIVRGISDGSIPDYQISAWAMAVYFRGMNERETSKLAMAMAYSGDVMDLSAIQGIKVDKHSTGGVGDKTTMVVIPLAAAAGIPVAKMSGRGLGHTGGTIDKFEAIPGFKVERNYRQFVEQVNRVKAAVVSQTGNLVPADKKLYALRDVTATVDSIPLIASSIMSKKIAAGAQGIVLDVKVGSGAFMKNLDEAQKLAELMVKIGNEAGRQVIALLTDMNQPLGRTVGNALEVREAIETLMGKGPEDLEELSVHLTAHMLCLAGKYKEADDAVEEVRDLLASGAGLKKFLEFVSAQEGQLLLDAENYGLPQAPCQSRLISDTAGFVQTLDALEVGRTAMHLGAGREKAGDKIDSSVGVELCKKIGDQVNEGDVLAIVHAAAPIAAEDAKVHLQKAYQIAPPVKKNIPIILKTILK